MGLKEFFYNLNGLFSANWIEMAEEPHHVKS
jgi:hypothetical protein